MNSGVKPTTPINAPVTPKIVARLSKKSMINDVMSAFLKNGYPFAMMFDGVKAAHRDTRQVSFRVRRKRIEARR